MKFEELNLNDNVLDALYDMRFETCTPIQEKCIPEILSGRDVLGVAQTGTGKTAAYLLPILSKLDDGGYPKDAINCIIMSPTRELAQQIDQAMQGFSYYLDGVSSIAVYGGNDGNRYDQELKGLSLGADVVIATPGRLISHLNMGNADFSRVSFFVLDEADRMLDMGFSEDIMMIAKKLPATVQTVMFSATMPPKIEELAKTLLKNPVEVKIAVSRPAEKIHQSAYICHEGQKLGIIRDIFKNGDLRRVIVFSGKKQKVKAINHALLRMGINSGEMHSDLEQAQRDEMMYRFKSGKLDVIVATDILARGIDIDDISMVVNFDVPRDPEDYVHRIGRTARADKDGIAITFVCEDDMRYFQQIEHFLGKTIERRPLPEELGEAPSEKPQRNNSAKARRRRDRDRTSHKQNKSRHADTSRQPPHGENAAEQGQATKDSTTKEPVVKKKTTTRKPVEKQERAARNPAKKQEQTSAKPAQKQRQTSTNDPSVDRRKPQNANEKRRHGRHGRRPTHQSSQPSAPKAAPVSPVVHESKGLKGLFKKPLQWIKGRMKH